MESYIDELNEQLDKEDELSSQITKALKSLKYD